VDHLQAGRPVATRHPAGDRVDGELRGDTALLELVVELAHLQDLERHLAPKMIVGSERHGEPFDDSRGASCRTHKSAVVRLRM
jgi:hypothetical protein